jgi:hypothetical protein
VWFTVSYGSNDVLVGAAKASSGDVIRYASSKRDRIHTLHLASAESIDRRGTSRGDNKHTAAAGIPTYPSIFSSSPIDWGFFLELVLVFGSM